MDRPKPLTANVGQDAAYLGMRVNLIGENGHIDALLLPRVAEGKYRFSQAGRRLRAKTTSFLTRTWHCAIIKLVPGSSRRVRCRGWEERIGARCAWFCGHGAPVAAVRLDG